MKKFMNKKRLALGNSQGFTLIEVVLVLAIGGLIFLLAFVAFQQVSRNRRDTVRRSDAGRVLAEMSNAQADGFTITSANVNTDFKSNYMGTPAGPNGVYTFQWGGAVSPDDVDDGVENMWVGPGRSCNGSDAFTTAGGSNAVIVALETGYACRDDS